jgi:amidohydrolase
MTVVPGVDELTAAEMAAVVGLRHAMHRRPELSNREWQTQSLIRRALADLGLPEPGSFHQTGLYVDIRGTAARCAGPSLVVRGDIDALPIAEADNGMPFRSEIPGVMHACGHDLHASIALATAAAAFRMRDSFSGTLRVVFQPAEEAEPLGGRAVVEAGLLDGFDHAIGFHVAPDLPAGTFCARKGPISKSADGITMVIKGASAHAATPYRGVDAIVIAAGLINELQKIAAREMRPSEEAVVSIGTIRGGRAANILCDEVELTGTLRALAPSAAAHLRRRVPVIAEAIATMHRGSVTCEISKGEPSVVNDAALVERFRQHILRQGADMWVDTKEIGGSDDFGFYAQTIPSLYFWFGSTPPGQGRISHLHTPEFAVGDDVLGNAIAVTSTFVLDLLSSQIVTGGAGAWRAAPSGMQGS